MLRHSIIAVVFCLTFGHFTSAGYQENPSYSNANPRRNPDPHSRLNYFSNQRLPKPQQIDTAVAVPLVRQLPVGRFIYNPTMGCDGIHASGLKIDNCGVCGGNEQSCQYLHGFFRSQFLANDYHLVVTIPAGATRINITEQYKSRSYLALRSGTPGKRFYINGDLNRGTPDRSKNYDDVASTRFIYQRPFLSEKGESLQSLGPTSEPLEIMIFYQGENPGIRYEYTIPKPGWNNNQQQGSNPTEGSMNRQSTHHRENQNYFSRHQNPRVDPSPPYNPPLGPVYPSRSNVQFNNRGRSEYQSRLNVDGRYNYWPQASLPEPETDTENVDSASADESTNIRRDVMQISRQITVNGDTEWRLKGFGQCSKSCAGGVQLQIYDCVVTETGQTVQDHLCSSPKPEPREQRCGKKPCPAYWDASNWSDCTRTCGNGRRSRRVVCRRRYADDISTAVFHKRCSRLNKPKMHDRCNVQPCARWVYVGGWGKCNAKCGPGSQTRHVACMAGGNREPLAESLCANSRTLTASRPCDAGPCITQWFTTKWQTCSADCGKGKQRRDVVCLNTAESPNGCPSESQPNSTRPCSRTSCGVTYEWFTGKWGACSSKCGNGVQKRKVTCLRVTPDGTMEVVPENEESHCSENEKPDLEQNCNTQSCGSRWHFSPWSECSVSCGGGSRTRDVQCLDEQGNYNSLCDIDEKPIHAEKCNTVSCHSLIDPDCEDRMKSTCRMVLKARLCGYPYYKQACCHTCTLGRSSWHS